MAQFIESMNKIEKQWLAYAIAGMICSDGHLDAAEEVYLREAISFLEDREMIQQLMARVRKRTIGEISALKMEPQLAFNIMKHLAGVSIVDNKMSPSEVRYFKQIGELLGLPEKILDKILSTARQHLEAKLPSIGLDILGDTYEVPLLNLNEKSCMFRFDRALIPQTRVLLNFYNQSSQEQITYTPVTALVHGASSSKSTPGAYTVKAEFQHKILESHGVLQIINPEKYKAQKEEAKKQQEASQKLQSTNKSLLSKLVQCYVCDQQDIPFRQLRAKSMMIKANTLGVPTYVKPMPGKDHCDYNLIQVTVCPSCFFASNDMDYFRSAANSDCPFDLKTFQKNWMSGVSKRQQKLSGKVEGFALETRSEELAILSYDYAIETHNALANLMGGDEQPRKVTSMQMIQAELYMNQGNRKMAENNLKEVLKRLEPIFTHLKGETIIRVANLMCLIQIYFKEYAAVSSYMGFLTDYDKEGKLESTSAEARALKTALMTLNNVYADRADYGHDKLTTFHLPQ